jgi:hypothetical protein
MRKYLSSFMFLVLLLATLAACAPAPTPTQAGARLVAGEFPENWYKEI